MHRSTLEAYALLCCAVAFFSSGCNNETHAPARLLPERDRDAITNHAGHYTPDVPERDASTPPHIFVPYTKAADVGDKLPDEDLSSQ